jgi:hypothetical protein
MPFIVDSVETEELHIPESDINEEDFDVVSLRGYFTDSIGVCLDSRVDQDCPTKFGQYPCLFGN